MKPTYSVFIAAISVLSISQKILALEWSAIKGQDSWQKVVLENQIENDITTSAYQITSQEVRLEQLPSEVWRELGLNSDNDFNESGFGKWKRECLDVEDYTPYVVSTNNHFEVQASLRLLRYDPRVWGLEGKSQLVRILNVPTLGSIELGIELSQNAVSRQVRNQSPSVTLALLNQQVQNQIQKSKPTVNESLQLDLSGLDALACDLAHGNAQIRIRAHYVFEGAKAVPDIQISANEIERLHEEARLRGVFGDKRDDRIASASAYLLQMVQDKWSRLTPDDQVQKTVQLLPGLVETNRVDWRKDLGRQDYVALMHRISKWKFEPTTGYTDYIFKLK